MDAKRTMALALLMSLLISVIPFGERAPTDAPADPWQHMAQDPSGFGPASRLNDTPPAGTLRGVVAGLNGVKVYSPRIRISNLYDSSSEGLAIVDVNGTTSEYRYDFTDPGKFQVYAISLNCYTSEVVNVTIGSAVTVWVNFTLVRREMINGTVTCEGLPIENAFITIDQPNGNQLTLPGTPNTGNYKVFVSSGVHNFTVVKAGYKTQTKSIDVRPGDWLIVNFTLEKEPEPDDEPDYLYLYIGIGAGIALVIAVVVAVLYARAQKKHSAPKKEDSIKEMECPKCGAVVKPDATKCPECGEKFKVRCPECGKQYEKGPAKCKQCGHDFKAKKKGE